MQLFYRNTGGAPAGYNPESKLQDVPPVLSLDISYLVVLNMHRRCTCGL